MKEKSCVNCSHQWVCELRSELYKLFSNKFSKFFKRTMYDYLHSAANYCEYYEEDDKNE